MITARTLKPKEPHVNGQPKMKLQAVKLAKRKPVQLLGPNGKPVFTYQITYEEAQAEVHGPLGLVWTPYAHNPKGGYIDLVHVKSGYSLALIAGTIS